MSLEITPMTLKEACAWVNRVHPHRKPLAEAVRIPEDEGASQLALELDAPCDSGYCMT